MNTNVENVVVQFMKTLKVPFTVLGLRQHLLHHPYFPSLLSISDTLQRYGVENESFQIEPQYLDRLPLPFVAYCKGAPVGDDFVLVESVSGEAVTIFRGKRQTLPRDTFLRVWQKVALIAEPGPDSGEAGYEEHRKEERRVRRGKRLMLAFGLLLALCIATAWALTVPGPLTVPSAALMLTKAAGLGLTLLLLVHDYGKDGGIVKELCSAFRRAGCDAVLESKGAGLAGVRWSEAGFWYFASSTLFLLYPGVALVSRLPWLYLGALAVSPYILYSIYYQARVVRQWCPLCLAVQGVLLAEAVQAAWRFHGLGAPGAAMICGALICILSPALGWYLLKPMIRVGKEAPRYEAAYKRMLHNPDYFQFLLMQQPEAPAGWERLGIQVGYPGAGFTILKVCNPYCGPCARAHSVIKELMRQNRDISLRIVFTATPSDADRAAPPARHLLSIAARGDEALTHRALDDWYEAPSKDYGAFRARYPLRGDPAEWDGQLKASQDVQLQAMQEWCREASVTHTPTLYINGRRLPEGYSVQELRNILFANKDNR